MLWRRLEYDFLACLLLCLASYVSFFVFLLFLFLFFSLHSGMFIFFVSLRLRRSHLLLSAGTYFIVRVLLVVSFVPYPISEFFSFLFVLL